MKTRQSAAEMDNFAKNENEFTHPRHSKPIRLTIFCETQKKIF